MINTNRDAIKVAKDYIGDVYSDEGITDVGLEEITRENDGIWEVTIGFMRDWQKNRSITATYTGLSGRRSYKTVKISHPTGDVLSMEEANWAKN